MHRLFLSRSGEAQRPRPAAPYEAPARANAHKLSAHLTNYGKIDYRRSSILSAPRPRPPPPPPPCCRDRVLRVRGRPWDRGNMNT
jgi:hypothetical protein